MKNKKGVSPVIATVLLVAMVIVIALIVFLWFRGLTQEAITKFGDKNIKLVCDDVQFDFDYSGGILSVSNTGNVPIYEIYIEITTEGGNYVTQNIRDVSNGWPTTGLNQGGAFSDSVAASGAEKIAAIPVLVGDSEKGQQKYVCESRHGKEILL
ncbi:hypothetical protein ISS08_02750 [Candidatus Pacearchaeota archaeon]|nr:hypothetical protein [Candidatus Pacearchaeota archaeon]